MIKIIQIVTLTFIFCNFTFAQGELFKNKKEQIKSLKIGFITNELDLTTDEATKFWPLFNAFEDRQQDIRQHKVKIYLARLDSQSITTLSDKEAQNLLNQSENAEEELFMLRKKFISNLNAVLPPIKILKLKKAEIQFSKKLLQQYRKRKE